MAESSLYYFLFSPFLHLFRLIIWFASRKTQFITFTCTCIIIITIIIIIIIIILLYI